MDGVVTAGAPDAAVCPACGEAAGPGARFCEACGAVLAPAGASTTPDGTAAPSTGPADAAAGVARPAAPATPGEHGDPGDPGDPDATVAGAAAPQGARDGAPDAADAEPTPCPACGGEIAPDGYCLECGARAPRERDHVERRASEDVGGVSDVGVRRRRNEDALALGTAGDVAVLVVCDGVASAPDSDRASRAAAQAARDLLVGGLGAVEAPAPDAGAWSRLLVAAGHAADAAVRAAVDDAASREDPPSCTFVAALAGPTLLVAAWLGDSRVYWLPDAGPAEQLTEDDSLAAELVAGGMTREQAERSRDAHAITRWLGADAEDATARTVATRPAGPGWVLACSDGLWNYGSAPDVVAGLVRDAVDRLGPDPVAVARDLVGWANARGGHDNVTVALARVAGPAGTDVAPGTTAEDDPGTVPTVRRRPAGSLAGGPRTAAPPTA
ncbi:protein phosphatase 2C domain-containing protein [Cellulomonas iranensis]|uniref:protein phosphatase 2C domain-containing protein n=1 Tax=Cellulomonas iranensis TaxID=76862 RepID=UPI003D7ED6E3